jgi:basic membrane protein A and related proteins
MTRSRRLLAAGFAAALGIAGVTIGSGSLSASSGGGICEGIDLGATAGSAPAGTDAAGTAPAGTEPAGTEPVATEPAGTEAAGSEPAGTGAAGDDGTTVALMFDVTGRGDKSFNDAAAAGLDRAVAEFGSALVPTESPPQSADDRAERVNAAAEGGNQLVMAIGFLWTDTIAQASAAYPDTHFLLVDSVVEADNVANIVFAEEQGSFLVGVAAALQSESGQLGFVGGVPNELIKKFEAGFVAGAQCVNPDAEVLVEYISDDPTIGFNDPARGREIAAAMYENGAEIVYGAAGASTPGVLEATAAAGEPGEVWTVGVDSDLYEQVDADLQPYVLTSMIKRVDNAVYDTIVKEINGEFAAGLETYDLSVEGVGYSTSGGFIDDYVPTIEALKAMIIDGTIEVPTAPAE